MARRAKDHREAELKFELDRRAARRVRHHPLLADAGGHSEKLTSQYFDTGKGKIRDAGFSLRVRRAGDDYTQTVKTRGGAGMGERGEWETPIEELKVDAKALKHTPLGDIGGLGKKLEPQVRSDVKRATWLIDRDGSLIEVALDSGTVSTDGDKENFRELELELREGEPAALFDLAKQLGQDVPLEIGVLSKEERGRMLSEQTAAQAHKACEPYISDDLTVGQAFAAVVQECVRHFRLNQALIVADRDPEALHQARVAMRRLKAGFTLFRPAIRQASLDPLKSELRTFLKPFGTARNLDVFLAKHGDELSWRDRRKLTSAQSDTYDEVVDTLKSHQTRDMMVDLVGWTMSDDWRKPVAGDPIDKFAATRLDRAWKKVKCDGAKLGDLKEKRLHQLRIDIKELRYSIEFLAPLYRPKEVRKFSACLETMQDCLGLIHDDMVSREIIADYMLTYRGRTDAVARSRQLAKLGARFKGLKRAGPFWR